MRALAEARRGVLLWCNSELFKLQRIIYVLSVISVCLYFALISARNMSTKISRTKNTAECLEIYYYNATSIRGKLDDFNSHFTCKDNLDIISVSESWLNDSVKDAEVLNQAYNVYRTDRN